MATGTKISAAPRTMTERTGTITIIFLLAGLIAAALLLPSCGGGDGGFTVPDVIITDICGNGELEDVKSAGDQVGVVPGTREAQDLCLAYVGQDAVATGQLWEAILEKRYLSWITGRGRLSTWRVEEMLTVRECLALPEPRIWANKPESAEFWNRRRWIGWIEQYVPDLFGEPHTEGKHDIDTWEL